MADAAELVVRIRGDASDLEATISGVSQQLEELERTQSNTNGVKGVRESTSAYQGLASQLKNTGNGAVTNTVSLVSAMPVKMLFIRQEF